MSQARRLFEIARRDLVQRAKSKAFLVTTLITVMVIVGVAPILAIESQAPGPTQVGVVGEAGADFRAALDASASAVDLEVSVSTFDTVADGETALRDGDIAVLVNGDELVWKSEEGPRTRAAVTGALASVARGNLVEQLGITPQEAAALIAPPPPATRILEEPDGDTMARRIAAQAGTFVLYMTIIIFGQFILLGVMEEKQSRVVEVVLSRVKPELLLAGKIIGIGLLGLAQIIVIGGAVLLAASMVELPDVNLPGLGTRVILTVVLWYLLGYALFAVMYGALGATVSRQEDVQGAAMIPTLLVVPGFGISIFSLEAPNALVPVIASYVPFTSPMVMPVRMAGGSVAWWEVLISVAIVVVTILLFVKLAGRVYRGAVLRIGPKVRLRDAWGAGRI